MHILFTSYEFITERTPCGGFGHYLANIASILANHGHQVTIVLSSYRNKIIQWKPNIEIVVFKYEYMGYCIESGVDALFHVNVARNIDRSKKLRDQIKKINKRKKIDIIQYNGDYLEGWYRIKKIPTVVRLSSIESWYERAEQIDKSMDDYSWLSDFKMRLFMFPLYRVDAVYAPSNCLAKIIRKKYKIDIEVIESPFFNHENDTNKENDIFGLYDKKYILFPNRICTLKGMKTVIDAANDILTEDPEINFVFAGHIGEDSLVERMYIEAGVNRERVHFLGRIINRDCLNGIMKHAYVCIFPSRADNLSNSCIECMGFGRIVIGCEGASYEQLIIDKKNGLLINRDKPNELLKAIRYVNSLSKEEQCLMRYEALKTIKRLSPENVYHNVIRFYRSIITEKKQQCCKKNRRLTI